MDFGEAIPIPLDMADGFTVGGGDFAPPPPDNILLYLLYAADTQYIVVEHFPVLFSHLDVTRCSKTAYMLSPFSCSGQTYIPTVKEFNSYFFKW